MSERPLRILHVIDSLGAGGAEVNLVGLVKAIGPAQAEHSVAWLHQDQTLLPELAPFVRTTLPLRARRFVGLFTSAFRLSRWLAANRPDVVHAKLIRASIVARIAGRIAGVPVLTTWECVSYTSEMNSEQGLLAWPFRNATWLLDWFTGRWDARVVAVSRQVAEHNARVLRVAPHRVRVVYNMVDPARIARRADAAELKRSLGIDGRGPLLLSVGRLVEQKDHATAIRAMKDIVARHPRAVLLIAGAGSLEASLRGLIADLGLTDNVRLLGPRRDVPALLASADVFVFASLFEGLGIALMEAIASGLPVVCTDIPTSRELADGLASVSFFPVGQPRALAESVLVKLDDLDSQIQLAQRAAEAFAARFSPASIGQEFLSAARAAAKG